MYMWRSNIEEQSMAMQSSADNTIIDLELHVQQVLLSVRDLILDMQQYTRSCESCKFYYRCMRV